MKRKIEKIYKVTTENSKSISTTTFRKDARVRDYETGLYKQKDGRPNLPAGADPFMAVGSSIVEHLVHFKGRCKVTVHVRGKKFTKTFRGLNK